MTKKEETETISVLKFLSLEEIREYMEKNLPLMIKRGEVKSLTGLYAKSTLANADCQGKGPKNPISIDSRTVAYRRSDLVDWIIKKIEAERKRKSL